ncbi:sugar phosphate isomerase/epimerase family protein [Sciscionella marina]|uniref:sugar phosphate isomerase/epimerase family protein n=1 Tax=Sciscionella marina TaxID=508770 RepID=UPI000373A786|nr:sugar phosphate isomerase/epimerase [Sciscionella marina]
MPQPSSPPEESFCPVIAASTLPLPARARDQLDREGILADLRQLAGFSHIDLVDTWISPAGLDPLRREILREALAELELRLAGISVIRRSIIDPVHGPANVEHTRRSIETAAELGAPVLSIGFHRPLTPEQQRWHGFWAVPGEADPPESFPVAVRLLGELCEYAADRGVALSLELYENTLLGSGTGAAHLVEEVGAPNLGINADLANLYRVPERLTESWSETLRAVLPWMNYWHVKNYRRADCYPDGPFLAWPTELGEGDIDYRTAFRLAAEADYRGPVCIEHYGGDGLSSQRAGLDYLRSLLR